MKYLDEYRDGELAQKLAREIHRIEQLIEPVRDMFSAIFFVAIGLLIDLRMLGAYWLPIMAVTAAVVVGKVVSCSLGAFVGGNDTRTSLRVGMGLAQIGEFSFIIASLGQTLKVTSAFLYPIAVAVSALTTLLTPYLIKRADGLVGWFVGSVFPRTAPEIGLVQWIAPQTLGVVVAMGVAAVALAPLLTARRLGRMDLPGTLRLME